MAEREAEIQHLRAEIERQGQTAQADVAAVKAAAEAEAEEADLKTAQARWEKTAAAALADTVGRCEAAEAALETARRVTAKRVDDDDYVHSLEREIKTLRATLVDREAAIVAPRRCRSMSGWAPCGRRRAGAGSPCRTGPRLGESEPSEQEKSNRRLMRDAGVVVMAAVAAVLLFPKLEAMLPDTVRWQIETVGGLFAPSGYRQRRGRAAAAVASTQPKVEHPRMYASRSINVRAEPSVSAAIAANLKRGAPVAILEKRGNWDRVEIRAGRARRNRRKGWVFNTYLTDTDPGERWPLRAAAATSWQRHACGPLPAKPPALPAAALPSAARRHRRLRIRAAPARNARGRAAPTP